MDTTLLLDISLAPNASLVCSGIPKFSGVSEIGDLKQDKAEKFDKIRMLQLFGKVSLCMHTGYVSQK